LAAAPVKVATGAAEVGATELATTVVDAAGAVAGAGVEAGAGTTLVVH